MYSFLQSNSKFIKKLIGQQPLGWWIDLMFGFFSKFLQFAFLRIPSFGMSSYSLLSVVDKMIINTTYFLSHLNWLFICQSNFFLLLLLNTFSWMSIGVFFTCDPLNESCFFFSRHFGRRCALERSRGSGLRWPWFW